MTRYAANTGVSTGQSRDEIERILARFGADQFVYAVGETRAMLGFRYSGRMIKLCIKMPDKEDFRYTPGRHTPRSDTKMFEEWEQNCRQRWRSLALVIKAKLVAIEDGIASFEDEFLAYTVLPDGSTVGDFTKPQLEQVYTTGKPMSLFSAMLPGRGRDRMTLKRVGECKLCGKCCQHLKYLEIVINKEHIDWIKAHDPQIEIEDLEILADDRFLANVSIPHQCSQLCFIDNGYAICSRHWPPQNLPNICRSYPQSPDMLIEGCGYSFIEVDE